ncbi:MAG: serine/threonine protein kinase, partial [Nanoarchaeota archaeon]|nr:serine/threonine protein kinase [Nanoarchaeota archaeon]
MTYHCDDFFTSVMRQTPGLVVDPEAPIKGGCAALYPGMLQDAHVLVKAPLDPYLSKGMGKQSVETEIAAYKTFASCNGIVKPLATGNAVGLPYLVLPHLVPVDSLVREMDLPTTLEIKYAVISTLEEMHTKYGLAHHDTNPTNYFLDGRIPLLGDLGTVEVCNSQKRIVGGTRLFLPPEQKQGKVLAANDVYAAGVSLFTMMACFDRSEIDSRQKISKERGVLVDDNSLVGPEQLSV